MLRTLEIDLNYQQPIDAPISISGGSLMQSACSNDQPTIEKWRSTWLDHMQRNKERFKEFGDHSIGKLFGSNKMKPAIICGSGPSLKLSIDALKLNAESTDPVLVLSCLHNFGYFEDNGFHADYYLTLDAGTIVIDDVSEGRKEKSEHYWAKTKGKKLLAYIGTDPKVFDLWQGDIYLFNIMIPEWATHEKIKQIEKFTHFVSCGGNALGGVFYSAKAILCSDPIMFVGADFCFDYNNQFHSYKTHYDEVGQYVSAPDVFGLRRKTWQSYLNFKYWFDWCAMHVPGNYINCSEGLLGAYPEGNIRAFKYMNLSDALRPYRQMEWVMRQEIDAQTREVLETKRLELKELFDNPKFEKDLVLF